MSDFFTWLRRRGRFSSDANIVDLAGWVHERLEEVKAPRAAPFAGFDLSRDAVREVERRLLGQLAVYFDAQELFHKENIMSANTLSGCKGYPSAAHERKARGAQHAARTLRNMLASSAFLEGSREYGNAASWYRR